MRTDGLFGREFETAFAHELLHKWFHFAFQQFFCLTGDTKVIGVPYERHLPFVGVIGSLRELLS